MSISMLLAPLSAQRSGMPVLVLGFEQGMNYQRVGDAEMVGDGFCNALVVDDIGRLVFVGIGELEVDWRFDWKAGGWREVGEVDGPEDDAVDGSAQFSGSVPEPDEPSSGD